MNTPPGQPGKPLYLLAVPLIILAALLLAFFFRPDSPPAPTPEIPEESPRSLAPLGSAPDWSQLDVFQKAMPRSEFLRLLDTVYTREQAWADWITLADDHALIRTDARHPDEHYRLDFARAVHEMPSRHFQSADPQPRAVDFQSADLQSRAVGEMPSGYFQPAGLQKKKPRHGWAWRDPSQLPPAPAGKALAGIHIALDPGHIGGDFAQIEERHLVYGDHDPIREGEMTLLTCQKLKPLLENLGATVTLVRSENQPVTSARPANFHNAATPLKLAERLFYRTAEILARAELVNQTIQPDLVLCLHFNASASPVPLPGQDFHLLLNGTYHSSELVHDDERFQMLARLLSRTYEAELPLARHFITAFQNHTGLPAYQYPASNPFAQNLDANPYLWARNLLANRSYHCPVLFFEPYTMNSPDFIARHRLGDYPGTRLIDGIPRRSLYAEYALAIRDGLLAWRESNDKPDQTR
ncbi:MAG: N-acetylmuramoyl-L-alanine amidase [Verrucomicrobiales bacterium]